MGYSSLWFLLNLQYSERFIRVLRSRVLRRATMVVAFFRVLLALPKR